ncbi:MAG: ETC complex I subunit [Pseudomonadota bacterium]|nr:ETC complex I subunit [Pseudomonadota bacterium]
MEARIFQPTKTAMQSGQANTRFWILEYEPEEPKKIDHLMGWTSSGDMRGQIRLKFKSKDEAVSYAENNNIQYNLVLPKPRKQRPKSYADNFRFDKIT